MDVFEEKRRSFLFSLGGLGISRAFPPSLSGGESTAREGYALEANGGEHLVHFRDQGNIFIKVGCATGSENLAIGTQEVKVGAGIPTHRHFQMDESFFILEGKGTFILNDVPHSFEKGGSIFIPRNSWHGFANPDHELLLLWMVSPAGLDGFFRETCNPPGVPPKRFTQEQMRAIALKYGTEFR